MQRSALRVSRLRLHAAPLRRSVANGTRLSGWLRTWTMAPPRRVYQTAVATEPKEVEVAEEVKRMQSPFNAHLSPIGMQLSFLHPLSIPGPISLSSSLVQPQPGHRFLPLTRRELLRGLVEAEGLLSPGERRGMEALAAALDTHFSQRFYTSLAEAKVGRGGGGGGWGRARTWALAVGAAHVGC